MDDKTKFAMLALVLLSAVLVASWFCGKDGVISTAIFGLFGVIAGSILGFKFGKE